MTPAVDIQRLIAEFPLISDQVDEHEVTVILRELQKALQRTNGVGNVVEMGCYIGTTSLFIRRLLNALAVGGEFHVYDSFEGLPDKSPQDMSPIGRHFTAGELAVSRKQFELQFKKAGLRLPRIHKGWFSELEDSDIPNDVAFAYLDGDYYDSIRDSFRLITSKLAPGAILVVDDYANDALPGAAMATDEWATVHSTAQMRVEHSLAIITT